MRRLKLMFEFIIDGEPNRMTFCGRKAQALLILKKAGPVGITTSELPAGLRWSAYVFELRKDGIIIEMTFEAHGGAFPGRHGRYRLVTPCRILEDAEAL